MSGTADISRRRERAQVWRLPILGGVTLMHVHYSHQRFRPHRHEVFTIGAIFDGQFGIEVDGVYRRIPAGTFSFLPPGALHTGECLSNELQYRNIYVSRAALEQLAGLQPGGDRTVVFDDTAPHDHGLLAEFVAAHEKIEGAPEKPDCGSDLEEVLAEIVRRYAIIRKEARREQLPVVRHQAVRAALQLLEAHYHRHLDLDELANRGGISRFQLIRLFKMETGLTPHSYLIWHRVKQAKDLLLRGLPPAETALAVGFYDQSHLGRYFRDLVGATPSEFAANSSKTTSRSFT